MHLTFQPLLLATAHEITTWIYPPPYEIYGYQQRPRVTALAYLTAPEHRFYAAYHRTDLVGFRSFGADGRVAGGDYDGRYLDTGGGLRPDLTGQGLGRSAIAQGLHFGTQTYGTQRFRVTIAAFNLRAQKTCQHLGFQITQSFLRPTDQKAFHVLTLDALPPPQATLSRNT